MSGIAQAQNADAVIKKYVAFIGGEKKWKTVKTITTSGEYDYGGMKFPFSTYSKAPNLYKFVVPFNGKYYAQGFDGIKGWKIDAFKNETTPTLLTGKAAEALANEADVELENPFVGYASKGHTAILEGTDTIANKMCYKIKFTRNGGEVETYYFEKETSELVMKSAASKNTELQGALLNTYYSNYHDVDGIRIPFQSLSEANGQMILTVTVEKAAINTPLADKIFKSL